MFSPPSRVAAVKFKALQIMARRSRSHSVNEITRQPLVLDLALAVAPLVSAPSSLMLSAIARGLCCSLYSSLSAVLTQLQSHLQSL